MAYDPDYKLRIVFMGTPRFAVPSLDILIKNDWPVVAVVTAPDKPAGRGQKLSESDVKIFAVRNNIPVLQPDNLKDPEFLHSLIKLKAELFVVVAFRVLPEEVFSIPSKGTFNLHASRLPDYRGAAPINWAIINGEVETGVTTFFIEKGIDTGKIIFQEGLAIGDEESAGELHDRMMNVGARLVLETVKAIASGSYSAIAQPNDGVAKPAPKIFNADCEIDYDMKLKNAFNFVRGLSPYPGAWIIMDNKKLKIFKASMEPLGTTQNPGEIVSDNRTFLKLALKDGYLNLLDVQMEGKKRMPIDEFIRGYNQ